MLKTNCAHASVRVDVDNTLRKFALEEHNVVRTAQDWYVSNRLLLLSRLLVLIVCCNFAVACLMKCTLE